MRHSGTEVQVCFLMLLKLKNMSSHGNTQSRIQALFRRIAENEKLRKIQRHFQEWERFSREKKDVKLPSGVFYRPMMKTGQMMRWLL